jgi:hypothetical protein
VCIQDEVEEEDEVDDLLDDYPAEAVHEAKLGHREGKHNARVPYQQQDDAVPVEAEQRLPATTRQARSFTRP